MELYRQERSIALPQLYSDVGRNQFFLAPYHFRQQWILFTTDWSLGDWLLKTSEAAQNQAWAEKAREAQIRIDVDRRTTLLYVGILQKKVHITLLREKLDLLEAHLKISKALWQAGIRTQLDVLQTESEIIQIKEQMAAARIEKDNQSQELASLIEWPDFHTLQVKPLPLNQVVSQAVPSFRQKQLEVFPLIQSLNFAIKAQDIRLKSVRASKWPHFNLTAGYMTDADPTGDGNYWQMSAGITFPVFRWGLPRHQREQAQAELQVLKLQKKETAREITIQAEKIIERMKQLKGLYALQQERLKTTNKAFQYAEVNYQAGLITNLEYLTTQQQLMETQIAVQETLLEYVVNLIEFYAVTNQMEKIPGD